MFWSRRRNDVPKDMAQAIARIRAARVVRKPFPHIVIKNTLPVDVFGAIKTAWPQRDQMWHEDNHDRYWAYFNGEGSETWKSDAWGLLKATAIDPMFAAISDRLRPYFEGRYIEPMELEPRMLALHEAGLGFVEHKPHTHFEHNPRYAFTVLFCVDDDDFTGRGTTLYGFPKLPPSLSGTSNDAMMHAASGQLKFYLKPMAVAPFEPNRLLAFVDGPISIHGSTPFTGSPSGARRMILSHVTDRNAESEIEPAFCIDQFNRYRDGNHQIDDSILRILEIERRVLKRW